jgi:hypothetical protein
VVKYLVIDVIATAATATGCGGGGLQRPTTGHRLSFTVIKEEAESVAAFL